MTLTRSRRRLRPVDVVGVGEGRLSVRSVSMTDGMQHVARDVRIAESLPGYGLLLNAMTTPAFATL